MKLTKITIAPIDTAKMVKFYNAVFDTQLKPFEAMGTTLYSGNLGSIELLFCPNEILDIKAEKNRQQLTFMVEGLDSVVQKVEEQGGVLMGDIQDSAQGKACGVTDPDGNSIELIESG